VGQGKSYIGLHIACCVATGKQFLGKGVQQGNALYVDFELDEAEQARRAYKVARGLGLEKPPEGLFYFSPLTQENTVSSLNSIIHALAKVVEEHDITLTVIDSFGAAVSGDPESAKDVTALFRELRRLGTVLILDHQSKSKTGERYKDKTAFGSVYKQNMSRNIWQLQRNPEPDTTEDEITLALFHKKSNFGPLRETIYVKATFTKAFTLEKTEPDVTFADSLSAKDRVLIAFMGRSKATAEQVANDTELALKTVKNSITALKKEGKLTPTGEKDGQANFYKPTVPVSPSLRDKDRDAKLNTDKEDPYAEHNARVAEVFGKKEKQDEIPF
jgi:RecA-family ATPase